MTDHNLNIGSELGKETDGFLWNPASDTIVRNVSVNLRGYLWSCLGSNLSGGDWIEQWFAAADRTRETIYDKPT